MEHRLYSCPSPCPQHEMGVPCNYCDGGLGFCTVCKGAEATLPRECPGREMTNDEEHKVQNGLADFRNGEWQVIGRIF